jgi:SET domain-containing protein
MSNILIFNNCNLNLNEYTTQKIYIKYTDINGYGLFANEFISKNELIYSVPAINIPIDSTVVYSFKPYKKNYIDLIINHETHLTNVLEKDINGNEMCEFTYFDIFINNSCDPNAYYVNTSKNNKWNCFKKNDQFVVALHDIQKNEQIFVDYDCLDWISTDPFKCNCNSPLCVKYKRGFTYLPKDIQQKYFRNNLLTEYVEKYYKLQQLI